MCRSAMLWLIGTGIVLSVWGICSIVGTERTRLIQKMQHEWRQAQALAAKHAAEASR